MKVKIPNPSADIAAALDALNAPAVEMAAVLDALNAPGHVEKKTRRLSASIQSEIAVKRMMKYLNDHPEITATDLATLARTTDRTLRKFRGTHRLKRGILTSLATVMGMTLEELIKPE